MTPAETPPNPLPVELPSGVRYDCRGEAWETTAPCRLNVAGDYDISGRKRLSDGQTHDNHVPRGLSAKHIDWSSIPTLSSPPSPAEGEAFKVGDEVDAECYGRKWRARVIDIWCPAHLIGLDSSGDGRTDSRGAVEGWWVDRVSVRRATPPEGKEAAPRVTVRTEYERFAINVNDPFAVTCGDCGQPIKNPIEACMRTRVGGGRKVPVPGQFHAKCPKPDPYTTTRHGMNEEQVAAAMAELSPFVMPPKPRLPNAHDLRVAAWKAAHLADFNRPVKPRHPSDWDVADADELRVT